MVALAIHGVSNRDESAFASTVARLATIGGPRMPELRPVFWGHLGPAGPLESIPTAADAAEIPEPAGAFGVDPPDDLLAAAARTEAATLAELELRVGAVDPAVAAEVHDAVGDAAARGWSVALSAAVAPLLVDTIVTAPPPVAAGAAGAFGTGWLKDRLTDVLEHVNDVIVDLLVREFREREAGLGGTIAQSIGDVLVYHSRGPEIRGVLDREYRRASPDGAPVDLVAHSLGALAAVEWLLGAATTDDGGSATNPADRRVRRLVTFGTQVSLFSELEGLRRGGTPEFGPGPGAQMLQLPVESWTNVWQELDPLAFVMSRVLSVSGATPQPGVTDLRLTQQRIPTDLSFHSSYWGDRRFAAWLAGHLED